MNYVEFEQEYTRDYLNSLGPRAADPASLADREARARATYPWLYGGAVCRGPRESVPDAPVFSFPIWDRPDQVAGRFPIAEWKDVTIQRYSSRTGDPENPLEWCFVHHPQVRPFSYLIYSLMTYATEDTLSLPDIRVIRCYDALPLRLGRQSSIGAGPYRYGDRWTGRFVRVGAPGGGPQRYAYPDLQLYLKQINGEAD